MQKKLSKYWFRIVIVLTSLAIIFNPSFSFAEIGTANDYIGLFAADAALNGSTPISKQFTANPFLFGNATLSVPNSPGLYEFRLIPNNSGNTMQFTDPSSGNILDAVSQLFWVAPVDLLTASDTCLGAGDPAVQLTWGPSGGPPQSMVGMNSLNTIDIYRSLSPTPAYSGAPINSVAGDQYAFSDSATSGDTSNPIPGNTYNYGVQFYGSDNSNQYSSLDSNIVTLAMPTSSICAPALTITNKGNTIPNNVTTYSSGLQSGSQGQNIQGSGWFNPMILSLSNANEGTGDYDAYLGFYTGSVLGPSDGPNFVNTLESRINSTSTQTLSSGFLLEYKYNSTTNSGTYCVWDPTRPSGDPTCDSGLTDITGNGLRGYRWPKIPPVLYVIFPGSNGNFQTPNTWTISFNPSFVGQSFYTGIFTTSSTTSDFEPDVSPTPVPNP